MSSMNVPGFPHFHEDEELIVKNRAKDSFLLACVVAVVAAYAVMTAGTYFDGNAYTSACYSHQLGDATPIYVYNLCYTEERKRDATAEVLDQLSNGLHTYSCRGTWAGEKWGIIQEQPSGSGSGSGGGGNKPAPNSNQPAPNSNNPGPGTCNQQISHPKSDGATCQKNDDCKSCDCFQNKCKAKSSGGRRLAGSSTLISYDNQLQFCANVMRNPKAKLRPFKKTESADDGVVALNKDTEYTFQNDDDTKTNTGTSSSSKYYEITEYSKMDASTLTCCGNRLKTTQERVLDWLAVIGGFAGLVHTLFFSISQATAQMGVEKRKANVPQAYAREVVVEM